MNILREIDKEHTDIVSTLADRFVFLKEVYFLFTFSVVPIARVSFAYLRNVESLCEVVQENLA